ncbi:SRPBCC family protein [Rhizobium sp. YIM 134829]|uniref:SRPBCC family protein n=1 Tax=Rhizobium sp. YIM 134829 TaxID=3390453 RepID=UPI00397D64D3
MSTDASEFELVLTCLIDATPEALFRCWTEPALIEQWFVPKPWTVSEAVVDLRPGGANRIVMRSPDGVEMPNRGVYLEVVPNRKLVFTDAYIEAWVPSEKPFMTAIISFEPEEGQTRYTARVRHWSKTDRDAHEQMGFQEGWGTCADQLAALARRL